MKTAISIPDKVFLTAERYAQRAKKSRSEVYSRALTEYMARHAPDQVTETMNAALAGIGDASDAFVSAAAHRALKRSEW